MVVVRPGSKIRRTTVSSRRQGGSPRSPFSYRIALLRTIEIQGTTAGHLARAVAPERNHAAAGAAPLVERARQMAYRQRAPGSKTAAANQIRPTAGSGRRSPPGAAKGRPAWS